jgi:NADH-quinone oxidoreductase subunit G
MKLRIDGREVRVKAGATIMEAADEAGVRIPRLCHHPKLTAPGSCRICAVEVEGMPGLLMSCREQACEGMSVRTGTETVRRAREDVLEFLLANHPLDCPVCDKSGECDLQDLYVEYSRRPSRFREEKVAKVKAQRIGSGVVLDAERCIECTRCIRFLEEIAGVRELVLLGRGDQTTIGVAPGAELQSAYALCAVDLCPVGALTVAGIRFKKSAWMLTGQPTICPGCARGCHVWLDVAEGRAFRMRPREHAAINGPWMCDAGRLTYKHTALEARLGAPTILERGVREEVGWDAAVEKIAALLSAQCDSGIACVLSAAASLEENLALMMLGQEVLGAKALLSSGAPHDPSFADAILRLADRNPNTAGAELLAKARPTALPKGMGFVVLGDPHPDDLIALVSSHPSWIVNITASPPERARWADVALPKLTHFEQAGTFISHGSRVQRCEAALPPAVDARPVWDIAGLVARAMGYAWEDVSPASCLAWGVREVKGLAELLDSGEGKA